MLPIPIIEGDIIGRHFPNCNTKYPHPGIVLKTFNHHLIRKKLASERNITEAPNTQICFVVMVSHSPSSKGEYCDIIQKQHKAGTLLDVENDLYVCYKHFDFALIPGQEKIIGKVGQSYLGRLMPDVLNYYAKKFKEIQDYKKGRSFKPPSTSFGF